MLTYFLAYFPIGSSFILLPKLTDESEADSSKYQSKHLWFLKIFSNNGYAHLLLNLVGSWNSGLPVYRRFGTFGLFGSFILGGIFSRYSYHPISGANGAICSLMGCEIGCSIKDILNSIKTSKFNLDMVFTSTLFRQLLLTTFYDIMYSFIDNYLADCTGGQKLKRILKERMTLEQAIKGTEQKSTSVPTVIRKNKRDKIVNCIENVRGFGFGLVFGLILEGTLTVSVHALNISIQSYFKNMKK